MFFVKPEAGKETAPTELAGAADAEPLRVGKLTASADGRRLSSVVDGQEIFFESDDVRLRAAPEALAQAMLLPALETLRPLVLEEPVEEQWIYGAQKLAEVFGQWWN